MPPRKTFPPPRRVSARRVGRSPTPPEPIPIPDSPPDVNPTPRPPPIRRSLPLRVSERIGARSSTPVQDPLSEPTTAPSPVARRSPMRRSTTPNLPRPPPPPSLQDMTQAQLDAVKLHMREEQTRIMSDIPARVATGASQNKKPPVTDNQPQGEEEPVRDTAYWISRWADEAAKRIMEAAATSKAPEQVSGSTAKIEDDPEMVRLIRELAMEGRKAKSPPKAKEGARPMKWKRKAFKKPDPSLVLTESEHSESETEEDEPTKAVQPKDQESPRGTVCKEGLPDLSSTSQEGTTLVQWRTSVKELKEKIAGKNIGAAATKKMMRKAPLVRQVPFADETTTTPQHSPALQAMLLRQRLNALNQRLFDSATPPMYEEPPFDEQEQERVEPAAPTPKVEKQTSETHRRANIDVNQPPKTEGLTASESENEPDQGPEATNAKTEETPRESSQS